MFLARFGEQDEVDQVLDEIDLDTNLNIIEFLKESDIDKIGVKSQLE